jgi:hypothetical protein
MSISLPRVRAFAPLLVFSSLLAFAACSWMQESPAPPPPADPDQERFQVALLAAGHGALGEAAAELRHLASRCESGPWGQEALLLLAALELSPGNPEGSPDAAAAILARYYQLSTVPARSLALAETMYLLALDLGADPVGDPFAPSEATSEIAYRFDNCHGSIEPLAIRLLPEPPGPATARPSFRAAASERDSLAHLADSLTHLADSLTHLADSLAHEMTVMEAELRRIRRLLLPDTVRRDGRMDSRP